jgi:prepilin-type N-terminal cleavage/methylation domain-containing protein
MFRKLPSYPRHGEGFTLIELMIVVTIIVLLPRLRSPIS